MCIRDSRWGGGWPEAARGAQASRLAQRGRRKPALIFGDTQELRGCGRAFSSTELANAAHWSTILPATYVCSSISHEVSHEEESHPDFASPGRTNHCILRVLPSRRHCSRQEQHC